MHCSGEEGVKGRLPGRIYLEHLTSVCAGVEGPFCSFPASERMEKERLWALPGVDPSRPGTRRRNAHPTPAAARPGWVDPRPRAVGDGDPFSYRWITAS